MADAKSLVDQKVKKSKKIMMFSKSRCPHSLRTKKVFDRLLATGSLKEEDYDVFEIDLNPNGSAIQDYLAELTGARTVPRVFINRKFVGGADDIARLDQAQELVPLLDAEDTSS